jgi:hypothetical protein
VIGNVAQAGDRGQKPGDEGPRALPPLKLKVTLTDGQIVTLNAAELVIDFGANGQLLVKSNALLPVRDNGGKESDQKSQRDSDK